ncbi:uncharacterized protein AMSG_02958 [Thecamonas trahens ATCC 50062]|uniref:Spatacsin C-terminal domain-containing protein n=1 Tax=Thecamonas trahens ATCC 50062 TaxID=461836 RepID=A0A0L0D2J2_THETB|nr:hypothetical protein AMSG_02958 [Thecamonas trahens ATCC 50062]KNC46522.1 hypothetical protein AMSG_02958 [Thecamonas trahens ATCC 50062]|eukprot:XP_013760303.1 hypothetical protein AMSG_02958 [Thecamonas trahens ATCC 50062]
MVPDTAHALAVVAPDTMAGCHVAIFDAVAPGATPRLIAYVSVVRAAVTSGCPWDAEVPAEALAAARAARPVAATLSLDLHLVTVVDSASRVWVAPLGAPLLAAMLDGVPLATVHPQLAPDSGSIAGGGTGSIELPSRPPLCVHPANSHTQRLASHWSSWALQTYAESVWTRAMAAPGLDQTAWHETPINWVELLASPQTTARLPQALGVLSQWHRPRHAPAQTGFAGDYPEWKSGFADVPAASVLAPCAAHPPAILNVSAVCTDGVAVTVATTTSVFQAWTNSSRWHAFGFPMVPLLASSPSALGGLPAHFLLGDAIVVASPHVASRQALINATIIFEDTETAHALCALNGWGRRQLRMHALKLGILYRQVDVVRQALRELDASQALEAIAVLLAFFDEASAAATARDYNLRDFARMLAKLTMSFLSTAISAAAAAGSDTSGYSDALVSVRTFMLSSSKLAAKFVAEGAAAPDSTDGDDSAALRPSVYTNWASLSAPAILRDALIHSRVSTALAYFRARGLTTPSGGQYSLADIKTIGVPLALATIETYVPADPESNELGPGIAMLSSLGLAPEPYLTALAETTLNRPLRNRLLRAVGESTPRSRLDALRFLESVYPVGDWSGRPLQTESVLARGDEVVERLASELEQGLASVPPAAEPACAGALVLDHWGLTPLPSPGTAKPGEPGAPTSVAGRYFAAPLSSVERWSPQVLARVLVDAILCAGEGTAKLSAALEELRARFPDLADELGRAVAVVLAQNCLVAPVASVDDRVAARVLASEHAEAWVTAKRVLALDTPLEAVVARVASSHLVMPASVGASDFPSLFWPAVAGQLFASAPLASAGHDPHQLAVELMRVLGEAPTLRLLYAFAEAHNVPNEVLTANQAPELATKLASVVAFRVAGRDLSAAALASAGRASAALLSTAAADGMGVESRLLVALALAQLEDPDNVSGVFARFEWDPPPRPGYPTLFALLDPAHPRGAPVRAPLSDTLLFDVLSSAGDMSLMATLATAVDVQLATVWGSGPLRPLPSLAHPPPRLDVPPVAVDLDVVYYLEAGQPGAAYTAHTQCDNHEQMENAELLVLLRRLVTAPDRSERVSRSAMVFAHMVGLQSLGLRIDAVASRYIGLPDAMPRGYGDVDARNWSLVLEGESEAAAELAAGVAAEFGDDPRASPEAAQAWRMVALATRLYTWPLEMRTLTAYGSASEVHRMVAEAAELTLPLGAVASRLAKLVPEPQLGDHVARLAEYDTSQRVLDEVQRAWLAADGDREKQAAAMLFSAGLLASDHGAELVTGDELCQVAVELQIPSLAVLAVELVGASRLTGLVAYCEAHAKLGGGHAGDGELSERLLQVVMICEDAASTHALLDAIRVFAPGSGIEALVACVASFQAYMYGKARRALEAFLAAVEDVSEGGDELELSLEWYRKAGWKSLRRVLAVAPTRYEKQVLLELVAGSGAWRVVDQGAPEGEVGLGVLWKIHASLAGAGLGEAVEPDAAPEVIIGMLMERGAFDAARGVAALSGRPHDAITLSEVGMLVAAASANGWMYVSESGSEREGLWRQCNEVFVKHETSPSHAGEFFYSLADSIEPQPGPDELLVLYSLALEWFTAGAGSEGGKPVAFLDSLQTEVWTLTYLPESYNGSSSDVDVRELVVHLLNSGKVTEAMSIAGKLHVECKALENVSAAVALVRDASVAAELPDAVLALIGSPTSMLDKLRRLQEATREAKDAFEHIITNYRVASVLQLSYDDVLAKDPYQVVFVLLHQGRDNFALAGRFISLHELDTGKIGALLAKVFTLALETHHSRVSGDGGAGAGGRLLPEAFPMWSTGQFGAFAALCKDLTRLGDCLMDAISQQRKLPGACEVEIMARAHFCYDLAGAVDVVDALLELVRAKSESYLRAGAYGLCAFLFRSLKRYRETMYILDALMAADAFDLIFAPGSSEEEPDWRLQFFLRQYLQVRAPNDLSKLTKLYARFGMVRERAETLMAKADEALAVVGSEKPGPGRHDACVGVFRLYLEASKSFQLEDCLHAARRCMHMAALVGLQLEKPGEALVGLTPEQARVAMADQPAFREAYLVAQAYDVGQQAGWLEPIFRHAIQNSNSRYFDDYRQTYGATPSLFIELSRYYDAKIGSEAALAPRSQLDAFLARHCLSADLRTRILNGEFQQQQAGASGDASAIRRSVSLRR